MRSSEIKMMKNFKICLGINNKIGRTKTRESKTYNSYRIQIGSVQFYNWLIDIGLFPAKTYTIGPIKLPDKYFRDFVRGHLDGDGSIVHYYDNYQIYRGRTYNNMRVYVKLISASKVHIDWLSKKIYGLTGINGASIISKPRSKRHVPIYQIKFSKKSSLELFKWMYYNDSVPCLKRKRDIVERAITAAQNESRKPYKFIKT